MSPLASDTPTLRHVDGHTLSHLHSSTTTTSLVPILTPPIRTSISSGKKNSEDRQYILVPNSQRIVVRSAHHGKKICDLVVVPTRVDGDDNGGEQERNDDFIRAVTLAWLPSSFPSTVEDDDDDDHNATNNGEWVILAGCKNGMVHEWSVSDLSSSDDSDTNERTSRRSFQLIASTGNKSSMKKTAIELMHMTCPSSIEEVPPSFSGGNIMLYGLVTKTMISSDDTTANNDISLTTKKKKKNNAATGASSSTSSTTTWLVRIEIPPFVVPSTPTTSSATTPSQLLPITLLSVKNVPSNAYNEGTKQDKFVCLKTNDSIFGFLASYRRHQLPNVSRRDRSMLQYRVDGDENVGDSTSGDIFVVMCSSHGLAIYRDSLATKNSGNVSTSSPSTKLVHFAKMMKASNNFIPEEEMIITSSAISPDTKDLALGRGGGQIEILGSVFENVAAYLDRRKQLLVGKKEMKDAASELGGSESFQRLWQQHPEEVTIRRNVHWHAHPVRTLAFMSTSSGRLQSGGGSGAANAIANPMSLLSGGEESVLVTWQLDRNFHRPSHFVARVGRGGIVHMLTCRSSGKIIVFCSDNSIQCFDCSTHERDWAEFGLAAMALHGEEGNANDDSRRRGKRSSIIMVKDPITSIPMLTNLPGAPGMIHWYDPNMASVVGTLEVSQFVGYASVGVAGLTSFDHAVLLCICAIGSVGGSIQSGQSQGPHRSSRPCTRSNTYGRGTKREGFGHRRHCLDRKHHCWCCV